MGQPSRGGRGRECCGGACLWSHTRSRVTLLLLTVHLFTSLSAVAGADSNSGTAKSADPTSVDSGGDYVDREHERAGDVTTDDTVVEDGHCDAGGECSPRTEQTPPPPPPPPSEPLFTAATFIKLRAGHLTQEVGLHRAWGLHTRLDGRRHPFDLCPNDADPNPASLFIPFSCTHVIVACLVPSHCCRRHWQRPRRWWGVGRAQTHRRSSLSSR